MTAYQATFFAVVVAMLAGCGSGVAGTYRGDARIMHGREETDKPGYSLAEIRDLIAKENRTLSLLPNGRFLFQARDNVTEGEWRLEGTTLITLDDTGNGERIAPGLRVERLFTMGENGELILGTSFNHYNLEEFYTKE